MAFEGKDVSPEKKTGFTRKGREIILSKTRGRPFSGLVKKGMERGMYPEDKYIEAATLFACTGSVPRVSELTNIPAGTISKWIKEQRFKDLLKEIRSENNEKIDAKFTEIIEKSADLILDRLENGDFRWDTRSGKTVRVPVGAKDLSLVTAINIDKRQLIRGEPTSRTEQISEPDRLDKLAKQFESIANKFKNAPVLTPVIDVEFKEIEGEQQKDVAVDGSGRSDPA